MNFLVIQTAFIGDVILATPVLESLHESFPDANIDFLLRKGNESLLKHHPFIRNLWVWDKKTQKHKHQLHLIRQIRKEKYDYVINLQRYLSSGLFTTLSAANQTIGFSKNPLSALFTKKVPHIIQPETHEIDRNLSLLSGLADTTRRKPKLYPSEEDFHSVSIYKQSPYVCIAPTSVWFTKQFPSSQWLKLIERISKDMNIYLLGGPGDKEACQQILESSDRRSIFNLAGTLNLLSSAALMKDATMNYVNDSAPMHLASAMNASTVAIFCSTVPQFGFGPLSDVSYVVEISKQLECRPCHLHGLASCPKGHFDCALRIDIHQMPLPQT